MPELSRELCELLDREKDPEAAAREIGRFLCYREEARQALPALLAVAEHKAGEEGVMAVLGRRFALYPQPDRNDGEWAAWWADYYDVLADVPLAALESAMRAWVADPASQFMPKPGELRKLALKTPSRAFQRYLRARHALSLADGQAAPIGSEARPRVEPEEVRKMLAEYEAAIASKSPERVTPKLPSISGKPPEGSHITAEMKALMARRVGNG